MTAINTPFEMGLGPSPFLSPNYAPVLGNAGRNPDGWTFGGGGNYPRPFTSYSQRIVEASNSLGPFAMRIGSTSDGGDGRLFISTHSPSTGQLAFREQNWYTQNDGITGYVSKAEWWQNSIKVAILVRDVHLDGHPQTWVEVAFNSPGEAADYLAKLNPLGYIDGVLPSFLGILTGLPDVIMSPITALSGAFLNGGSSSNFGETHDTADDRLADVNNGVVTNFSTYQSDFETGVNARTGSPLDSIGTYINNFLDGIIQGEIALNEHIAHNITPQTNGSFDNVPGELKTNPRDVVLTPIGQMNFANSLGSGILLEDATGNAATDGAELADNFNPMINYNTADFGIRSNGKGIGTWLILGRTIYNEQYASEQGFDTSAAAQNPRIDSNGNLRIGDTYDFGGNNFSDYLGWLDTVNSDLKTGIESFFDTSPGFHKSGELSEAGKIRQQNGGGEPDNIPFSGISQLQNSYMDVVITPSALKNGNPDLYQNLRDKGYFDHVDPNLLP